MDAFIADSAAKMAFVADSFAGTAAMGAGALAFHHAEDRALLGADRAAPAAMRAGLDIRGRFRPGPMAMFARLVVIRRDGDRLSIDRIHEGDADPEEGILAFLGATSGALPSTASSEEGREDITEIDVAETLGAKALPEGVARSAG